MLTKFREENFPKLLEEIEFSTTFTEKSVQMSQKSTSTIIP